ncbi:UNVERIFIED_CONTAM: Mannose-6-phosphate isomerase 2 [Sesamum calycinum]|uniref:mannose-6-phosphate isomerase n=1 Tax=Sesamum calycinum TaxID=2727403 RepID=A0AAW2MLT9_9LAMI
MGAEVPGIVKLKCSVKNYDWGKVGKESAVARLCAKNTGEETDGDEPYAEFWMGTHDSGPSYVSVSVEANGGYANGGLESEDGHGCKRKCCNLVSLKDWIEQNPSVLGDKVLQKWGPNLPFLFKVLSVAKALSIQAHPDKDLAAILHKQQPGVYKDGNHKPEMALALTEFEALCGNSKISYFAEHVLGERENTVYLSELKTVVHSVPEIIEVVGSSCAEQVLHVNEEDGETKLKEVLQSLFTKLMSVSKAVISEVISKLISRLNLKREVRELTDKEELVLRLDKQYPGDVGVLAAFLFNYVKLNPGEALYLGANEPHAYLHGECVECMATSDNVVRAGLTPKNRDVQTLCSMLTYKQGFPEILPGVPSNPYTVKYLPPFDEFEVDRSFSEMLIAEGDVLFAPANTQIAMETISGMDIYRAGVNSRFLEKSDALALNRQQE